MPLPLAHPLGPVVVVSLLPQPGPNRVRGCTNRCALVPGWRSPACGRAASPRTRWPLTVLRRRAPVALLPPLWVRALRAVRSPGPRSLLLLCSLVPVWSTGYLGVGGLVCDFCPLQPGQFAPGDAKVLGKGLLGVGRQVAKPAGWPVIVPLAALTAVPERDAASDSIGPLSGDTVHAARGAPTLWL